MTATICERCKRPLKSEESIDLWLLVSRHDENGECDKSSMDIGDEAVKQDYVVIGNNCCGRIVIREWNKMINQLTRSK